MLDQVYFPSVTLCNINQGRSSLFHHMGLAHNEQLLRSVLGQAYYGMAEDLPEDQLAEVAKIFAAEEVIKKGFLVDYMFQETAFRSSNNIFGSLLKFTKRFVLIIVVVVLFPF